MKKRIVIGSRGSKLALAQTNHIADQIRALGKSIKVSVKVIIRPVAGPGQYAEVLEQPFTIGET